VIDGILRARVVAQPVEGAANAALVRLVANSLGVGRGRVRVRAGATSRLKTLQIDGVAPDVLRSRWPGIEV
jgi:uncharacterized protein YggU (UPF0235/DUF167 family)